MCYTYDLFHAPPVEKRKEKEKKKKNKIKRKRKEKEKEKREEEKKKREERKCGRSPLSVGQRRKLGRWARAA